MNMTALRRFGLLAPLVAVGLAGCGLNSVPTAEENVNAKWAHVQSEYQRRADLVPNLVETVKGYAAHERTTFEEVTKARGAAQQATKVEDRAQAENALTAAIGRLFAVAEAYPELRASENFQQLQAQLEETEQKIAVSRQVYNDTVLTYDTALETVPTNIVGGLFSFAERAYFELAVPEAAAAPPVRF
jgi:LemA protein